MAYLIRVHFELPHDLDGHLVTSVGISRLVDVAESSIAHLFHQDVSFESGIPRHLARLFSLLGDDGFNVGLDFLVLAGGMGGGAPSLRGDVSIVDGGHGILARLMLNMVLLPVSAYRVADAVMVFLLLCMHWREAGRRLVAGSVGASGLLAMTDKVFEVLNGAHFALAGCAARERE